MYNYKAVLNFEYLGNTTGKESKKLNILNILDSRLISGNKQRIKSIK